jgi:hypothetical protein
MNNILENQWYYHKYPIPNNVLTREVLHMAFQELYNKVYKHVPETKYILSIYKVETLDGNWLTYCYLQKHKSGEWNAILEAYEAFRAIKAAIYDGIPLKNLIFSFKVIDAEDTTNKSIIRKPLKDKKKNISDIENIKTFKKFGWDLPITMDLTLWGKINYETDTFVIVEALNSKAKYYINIFEHHLEVDYMLGDKKLFSFKDIKEKNESNLNTFKRYLKNDIYYFENSILILHKSKKKSRFLSPLKKVKFMNTHIITMDLETRTIDGCMWPFCVSIYDGKKPISFYLSKYTDVSSMMKASVEYLMKEKYNKHKVYLHNFSYFDSIFLLDTLINLSDKVKPTMRDGRIIDFQFKYKKNYTLNFRDSLLLLPESLSKLAKAFNVINKGLFPYTFVDSIKIGLDYNGKFPRFKFFNLKKEQLLDYINYKNSFKNKKWNLQEETIKYSELDTIVLYKVLMKFNETIYSRFRVDAFKYPTISSLAFAIYRTNYLKNYKIPLIDGKIYKDIKLSYTGGACDVYKPFGKQVYCYDVNSLYSSIMENALMPVGSPTYFEGDISKIEKDPFGFFEVEITAPTDINVPLLQKKIELSKGLGERTIAPVGTWTGVYFSEELKEALLMGYTYKIYRGYLFDKEVIFKDFVNDIFSTKEKSEKGSANYTIFKLILNSLYGRFGMKPIIEKHEIIDPLLTIALNDDEKLVVSNVISLNSGKELVSYFMLDDTENTSPFALPKLNISVPIASAITSYSRIYMNKFKNLKEYTLYYSDTDSLYIDKPLDPKYVSETDLGKFKLERILSKALFLSSKMYGGYYYDKDNKYMDYVKIKGVKNPIPFINLLPLLFKNKHIDITQEKWFRQIENETIEKNLDTKHTLTINSNKRTVIYENNKFIDTKPIILEK